MKYKKSDKFISNYIMFETYEIVGYNKERHQLNIYGEQGKDEGPIGVIELTDSDLDTHYTIL